MRRRAFALAALAPCAALAVACGAHDQVTPLIAIQPGAAARAMALLGHGGPNDPKARRAEVDAGGSPAASEPPGTIAFSCLEERGAIKALARVPCEVTLAPLGAVAAPDDPPDAFVSPSGKVAIATAAGSYRVTASRGPEYARSSFDIEVLPGKTAWGPNDGATVLYRVVDTRGYLAADLHGVNAGDAGDDAREAVFGDVAAGVEIVLGDVASIIQAAKLDDALASLPRFDLDALDPMGDRDALLARLAAKRPVTAVGSPPARTYVQVADDSSLSTWSPAREADLVRGVRERRDVVVTNGPFVRVTANGAPIGGVARAAPDRSVEVKVHVECAPWLTVDRVSIARASGAPVEPQTVTLRATPAGARAADVTFHLQALADDAFVVRVDASSPSTEPAPVGMTGALWIDADGDGESLGRKASPAKP